MSQPASRWTPATARRDDDPGELANATCALCGIELSIISLVPDGGPGSSDVRWYCRDIVSCTERWTAPGAPPASQAPAPRQDAPDPGAEASPDENAPPPGDEAPAVGDAPADVSGPGEVRVGWSGGGQHDAG